MCLSWLWTRGRVAVGGGSAPPAAMRYIDQKVAKYIGWNKKGMLGGRTHVKVEEQPEQKRPKKEVGHKRKGKTNA